MSKYSRLGKNTLLVLMGNFGSKMLSFLMLPFYTKWLSVEDYGVTDLITIYASFFLGIITCSISESIFIFPKGRDKIKQKEYFSTGFSFAFFSFALFAFLFFLLSLGLVFFEVKNSFSDYIWLIYFFILATFIQNYIQQFTRSIDEIKVYSISGVVLTLSEVLLAVFLIPKYGVFGFIISKVISLFIAALYSLIHSKAYQYFSLEFSKKETGIEMLKYSIPLIPNGIMWLLVSAVNRPILEKYHGLYEVGIFALGSKISSMLLVIISVFMLSWQISALEEFGKKGYKEFYNKVLNLIFTLLVFISCIVTIFSKPIIALIVSEKFIESWKLVPILTFSVLFFFISSFVGVNFSAVKKSKYYFYSSLYGALASIIISILLIPKFGFYGAAISVLLSYVVMAIARVVYSWKYVEISKLGKYTIMILINIILIFIMIYIENMNLKIIFSSILMFLLLLMNKDVVPEIKSVYLKLVKKI